MSEMSEGSARKGTERCYWIVLLVDYMDGRWTMGCVWESWVMNGGVGI